MHQILIDTDVLLDFFLARRPFYDNATSIMRLAEKQKLRLFITPVICANLHYILSKSASKKKVEDALTTLLRIVEVLPMDANTIVQALEQSPKDFEDALQYQAAVQNGEIEAILTRNIADFPTQPIPVMQPDELLALLMR